MRRLIDPVPVSIWASHVDWTRDPAGKVWFLWIMDKDGNVCGTEAMTLPDAREYATAQGLQWLVLKEAA